MQRLGNDPGSCTFFSPSAQYAISSARLRDKIDSIMEKHTLESFERWHEVEDYESDETTVTLLGGRGEPIAEFNYPKFTKDDFNYFKSSFSA